MTLEAVRAASVDDLPRCGELLALAAGESRRWPASQLAADLAGPGALGAWPGAEELGAWLGSEDRCLLVGEFGGAVVGLAAAAAEPRAGATVARIVACYVEAGARGVGVGEALMAELARWAAAAGCGHLEASALPGDRATKQLYEASGLKARLLVMHRPLTGD